MKWTHQYDSASPRIEMEVDKDATLPEISAAFEIFLRAAGYVIDGHLEIIDEETKEEV